MRVSVSHVMCGGSMTHCLAIHPTHSLLRTHHIPVTDLTHGDCSGGSQPPLLFAIDSAWPTIGRAAFSQLQ